MSGSRDLARLLLEKARGDYAVVKRLHAEAEIPAWTIGFHAQQTIEKSIKAVLNASGVEYPRTHNISMLLELLRKNQLALPPDAEEMPRLTAYGAAFRYEDEMDDMNSILDRSWAEACSARTIRWADEILAK